jgi:hypothetical protein
MLSSWELTVWEKFHTHMNLSNKILSRLKPPELGYIDHFYKRVVSELAHDARRQYCINLIGRVKADLSLCNCPEKTRMLQQLLRAAKAEIRHLRKSGMVRDQG